MSLIHDALRRGQAAPAAGSQRAAHPDSVLAALGYRSAVQRTSPRTTTIIGLVLAMAGIVYAVFAFYHTEQPRVPKTSIARAPSPTARVDVPAQTVTHAAPAAARPPEISPVTPQPTAAVAPPPIVTRRPVREATRAPALTGRRDAVEPVAHRPAPRETPATSATAPDDFQLALYYQRSGDFEQSLMHYKAVIGRDELNVEAHNNLGRLYLDKGLTDDAIREFERVTAIDPRYTRARINLAAAYFKQGRYDLSAAEARAALAIEPRNVDALVNLALAETAAGQVEDARESLLAALRIDQHNAAAHYNLARQYEELGEFARALSHYESFLKYAGPEQAAYAQDVRGRIAALSAKIK